VLQAELVDDDTQVIAVPPVSQLAIEHEVRAATRPAGVLGWIPNTLYDLGAPIFESVVATMGEPVSEPARMETFYRLVACEHDLAKVAATRQAFPSPAAIEVAEDDTRELVLV
jgi:hypothetical protein